MSLIGDALKKARQDVARQESLNPRLPYAVGAVDPPRRRVPLLPLLAGVGAGCLLAGLLLAFAWSAGWGPFAAAAKPGAKVAEAASPPAPATPRAAEPSAAAPVAVPEPAPPAPAKAAAAPAVPVAEERPQPSASPRPTPPPAAPLPSSPAPTAVEGAEPAPAAAKPSPPAAVRPAPAPPSPASPGGLVDGQTYAGEVPIPGGGAVKLNGIAFSPDRPIAVLDGRVMAPGESIQGFTLVAVEAGRIKLQGFGATVYVSPR